MDAILLQISASLTALGPWGLIVGVALVLGLQFLRQRLGPQPQPVLPTPMPTAATVAVRLDATAPLINRLLQGLGTRPDGKPITSADVSHEVLLQLRQEISALIEAKSASHAAALADLNPTALKLKD